MSSRAPTLDLASTVYRDKQQSSPRKRRNSRGTKDVDPKRSPTKGDLKGLWPVVFVDAPSEKKKDDHRRASFQRD